MISKTSSVLLLTISCIGLAHSQIVTIPTDSCTWRGGDYGVVSACFSDEIAVASCGSGRDADCANPDTEENEYDMLKCCVVDGYNYDGCERIFAEYGEDLSCLDGTNSDQLDTTIVEAICGSGRDDDCDGSSHMISCCVGKLMRFGSLERLRTTGDCEWQYGDFGDQLSCPTNSQSIFGRCGSGKDPDCNGSTHYHGIQCCTLITY